MVMKAEEEALREMLTLIVTVTLELQDRLRTMFLPTAERCHYIFTMKDLGNIFRYIYEEVFEQLMYSAETSLLCLNLKPTCLKFDTLFQYCMRSNICNGLNNFLPVQEPVFVSKTNIRKELHTTAVAE